MQVELTDRLCWREAQVATDQLMEEIEANYRACANRKKLWVPKPLWRKRGRQSTIEVQILSKLTSTKAYQHWRIYVQALNTINDKDIDAVRSEQTPGHGQACRGRRLRDVGRKTRQKFPTPTILLKKSWTTGRPRKR